MQKTTIIIANANRTDIVTAATERFGGCTAIETFGGWTDDAGRPQIEPGIQLTILHDRCEEDITEWAQLFGRIIGEQCIIVNDTIVDCNEDK